MKLTRVITAQKFHNPNELAEDFLNNCRKIINTDGKIIVSLSPKQSLYLEGLSRGKKLGFVPSSYTATGYYINKGNVYSWHLQKGTGSRDQIVAIFRYTLEDYQQGNIARKIEDTPRKLKRVEQPIPKIKRVKQPETQLQLWDDDSGIAA